jgi:predicted permease
MEDGLLVLLVVLVNAVVLVLGGLITHLAYRVYRRSGSREFRLFTVGFALLTLGFLVGGGLHQLLGADLLVGVLTESVLTACGLAALVYSLYATDPSDEREQTSPGHR